MPIFATREQYVQQLKNHILEITFLKKSGERRIMECTLRPSILPQGGAFDPTKPKKEPNPDTVKCWDLDNDDWRSFRIDSVQNVNILD